MNPALVMGRFLRHWRSWTPGMSQAHLASKVRDNGGSGVDEDTVGRWEGSPDNDGRPGQPPKNDQQLAALLKALANTNRASLTWRELDDFADLCIRAKGGRQFPAHARYGDDDLPFHAGVDAWARAAWDISSHAPERTDTIAFWAATTHLERAVEGQSGIVSQAQQMRQVIALATLRTALAHKHQTVGRFTVAEDTFKHNAEFIESWFGRWGRADHLSALDQRVQGAFSAEIGRPLAKRKGELLALSEVARQLDDPTTAAFAFLNGLAPTLAIEDFDAKVHACLRDTEAGDPTGGTLIGAHYCLYWAHAWQQRWEEAEAHLLACDRWPDEGMPAVLRHGAWGDLLRRRGSLPEAETRILRGLGLAQECGFLGQVRCFTDSLRTLETAKTSRPRK